MQDDEVPEKCPEISEECLEERLAYIFFWFCYLISLQIKTMMVCVCNILWTTTSSTHGHFSFNLQMAVFFLGFKVKAHISSGCVILLNDVLSFTIIWMNIQCSVCVCVCLWFFQKIVWLLQLLALKVKSHLSSGSVILSIDILSFTIIWMNIQCSLSLSLTHTHTRTHANFGFGWRRN